VRSAFIRVDPRSRRDVIIADLFHSR